MQCYCFYMHLWSLCMPLRRFTRVHHWVKTEKENVCFDFFFFSRSVVNPSARFLQEIFFYFGFMNKKISFNQLHLQRQHDESMRSFSNSQHFCTTQIAPKCESIDIALHSSNKSQEPNRVEEKERRKKNVYRTNITSYQTLDQRFYWAIFKRLSE